MYSIGRKRFAELTKFSLLASSREEVLRPLFSGARIETWAAKSGFLIGSFALDSLVKMMISHTLLRVAWRVSDKKHHAEFALRCISSTNRIFLPTNGHGGDLLHQQSDTARLRLQHSVEPIPYTDGFELTPVNLPTDKLGHKKVTIVGCGQVGMAIAYSMLNQVIAGTIALVDVNKEKLEGEAKDLEQGSAFHQYVRILASDEYVSMKCGRHYVRFSLTTQKFLFFLPDSPFLKTQTW